MEPAGLNSWVALRYLPKKLREYLVDRRSIKIPPYTVSTKELPRLNDFLNNWRENMASVARDSARYGKAMKKTGSVTEIFLCDLVVAEEASPGLEEVVMTYIRFYDGFDESEEQKRYDKMVSEGHKRARTGPVELALVILYETPSLF